MHAPASPLCASCLATLLSASSATLKCMTMTPMTEKSPFDNCWKFGDRLYDMPCGNIFIGRLAKRRGCSGPPTAGATTDGVAARTSAGRG